PRIQGFLDLLKVFVGESPGRTVREAFQKAAHATAEVRQVVLVPEIAVLGAGWGGTESTAIGQDHSVAICKWRLTPPVLTFHDEVDHCVHILAGLVEGILERLALAVSASPPTVLGWIVLDQTPFDLYHEQAPIRHHHDEIHFALGEVMLPVRLMAERPEPGI